jgi:F0F1-type ATP synthase assembly protein I
MCFGRVELGLPDLALAPAIMTMTNIVENGKRLVMRVMLLQAGCALIVGSIFWIARGAAAGWSGFVGGMIAAIGSGLFGWRMFAPGIAPATVLRRALFAGESLKWFWCVLAIWAAFARFNMMPLPLVTGLAVAQFGYWLGLIGMKRG